jgi:hypothetical protein
MKLSLTVIVLALYSVVFAQDDSLMRNAIDRPALSLRCKDLVKERDAKIKIQQRLTSLLQRNEDLIKKSPRAKNSLHAKLKASQIRVKNELYLANLQIDTMEENIIRSGCPGIGL